MEKSCRGCKFDISVTNAVSQHGCLCAAAANGDSVCHVISTCVCTPCLQQYVTVISVCRYMTTLAQRRRHACRRQSRASRRSSARLSHPRSVHAAVQVGRPDLAFHLANPFLHGAFGKHYA